VPWPLVAVHERLVWVGIEVAFSLELMVDTPNGSGVKRRTYPLTPEMQ
jgi:hypothetical protein